MENLIKEHIEIFGTNPNFIGLYWDNQEKQMNELIKAIETNKPYNEYELLTKEEQKAYDSGELVF